MLASHSVSSERRGGGGEEEVVVMVGLGAAVEHLRFVDS